MGSIAGKEAAQALVGVLGDPDGWVRYCAFRGLEVMRMGCPFQDWIFGSGSERSRWLHGWKGWLEKHRVEPPPTPEPEVVKAPRPDAPEPRGDAPPEKQPPAPDEQGAEGAAQTVACLVEKLVAAAEEEDTVNVQLLRREVVLRGTAAVPALLKVLRKPSFPVVIIDALEEITQRQFGFEVEAWERWWNDHQKKA